MSTESTNQSPVDELLALRAEKKARDIPASPVTSTAPEVKPAAANGSAALRDAHAKLSQYNALQGRARSAYFREHQQALHAAAAIVDRANEPTADSPNPQAIADARALFATYNRLQGKPRAIFLREHSAELTSAAKLLS